MLKHVAGASFDRIMTNSADEDLGWGEVNLFKKEKKPLLLGFSIIVSLDGGPIGAVTHLIVLSLMEGPRSAAGNGILCSYRCQLHAGHHTTQGMASSSRGHPRESSVFFPGRDLVPFLTRALNTRGTDPFLKPSTGFNAAGFDRNTATFREVFTLDVLFNVRRTERGLGRVRVRIYYK